MKKKFPMTQKNITKTIEALNEIENLKYTNNVRKINKLLRNHLHTQKTVKKSVKKSVKK